MQRRSFVLYALIAAVCAVFAPTPASAAPQIGANPSGNYELRKEDGSAIKDGVKIGAEITQLGTNIWSVVPWIEDEDGDRTPLPGEQGTLSRIGYPWDNMWVYENLRGNIGAFVWNTEAGQFESEMLTGPNAGTKRIFKPLPPPPSDG
ncbi:MAG: hypothetical protein AAF726_06510 [Planctomycetota bacterium]